MQIKTLPEISDKLIEFIISQHEYKVPEILIINANTSKDYFAWMESFK